MDTGGRGLRKQGKRRARRAWIAPACLLGLLTLSVAPASAAPANDAFVAAAVISALPYSQTFDAQTATTEPGEPAICPGSPARTVWFRFVPATDMRVQAVTTSTLQHFGAIAIFEGTSLASLQWKSCSNSSNPMVTGFDVVGATTYYIRVSSDSVFGPAEFGLRRVSPPDNDERGTAHEIATLPFEEVVDARTATAAAGDPTPSCAPTADAAVATVWYAYTAPAQRRLLTLRVNESEHEPDVAVYTDSGGGLVEVACESQDDGLSFAAEGGGRYWIMLRTHIPFNQGDWVLGVEQGKLPAMLGLKASARSIPYRGQITLTAHLDVHDDVASKTVSIYASRTAGEKLLVASGALDGDGDLTVVLKPTQRTTYHAEWAGETRYAPATSVTRRVLVGSKTTLAFLWTRGRYRGDAVFRPRDDPVVVGRVVPKQVGARLAFKLEVWTGRIWLYLAGPSYKIGRSGAVAVRVINPTKGYRYRIRANFAGSATNGSSTSGWKYFRVRG